MLAVGFEEDVERIMESIPEKDLRQTCLSATMPSWVKKLSRKVPQLAAHHRPCKPSSPHPFPWGALRRARQGMLGVVGVSQLH